MSCRHILTVLHNLVKRNEKPDIDTLSLLSSLRTAKVYTAVFSGASVTVPLERDVEEALRRCPSNPEDA